MMVLQNDSGFHGNARSKQCQNDEYYCFQLIALPLTKIRSDYSRKK